MFLDFAEQFVYSPPQRNMIFFFFFNGLYGLFLGSSSSATAPCSRGEFLFWDVFVVFWAAETCEKRSAPPVRLAPGLTRFTFPL